jgi:gliding motility-associated lipoprotein GldH
MKRKGIIWLFFGFVLIITSCADKGPVFEKYHKFENSTWDRFNQVVFTIPLEPEEADYAISMIIKPTEQFDYPTMPVYVILTTPSGEERMNDIKVPVKQNNKFIGKEEGKPLIIKSVLWKELRVSGKGNCKLSIENMIPKIQTPGIAEIGIIVEKVDPK